MSGSAFTTGEHRARPDLYAGARRRFSGVGTIATGFVALVLVLGALLTSELDHYAGEDSSAPLNSQATGSAPRPGSAPAAPVVPDTPEPSDTGASAAPGGMPPPSASPKPSGSPRAAGPDETNRAVLTTVNRTLAALDCDPVEIAPALVAAARSHMTTMLDTGYLTLEGPDGTGPRARAKASGFTGPVVEVIVLGAESAAQVATIGLPGPGADDALPITVQAVARKPLSCGYTAIGADFRRDSRNVPIGVILLGRP